MTRPSLHVCVATGQNLANLIPALQSRAAEIVILKRGGHARIGALPRAHLLAAVQVMAVSGYRGSWMSGR